MKYSSISELFTAIANSIRGKTGSSDPIVAEDFPEAIDGIDAGGGENPLDYATSINSMFQGAQFAEPTDITISFGSKATGLNLVPPGGLQSVFYRASNVRSIKVAYGGSAYDTSMATFVENGKKETALEKVDLSGTLDKIRPTGLNRVFYNRAGLREIVGEFDLSQMSASNSATNAFVTCEALETIRFKEGTIICDLSFAYSPKLTDETIQNIIDGLADLTGGTTQTLTLHANVGAKLTDAQKTAASAKNWTISY